MEPASGGHHRLGPFEPDETQPLEHAGQDAWVYPRANGPVIVPGLIPGPPGGQVIGRIHKDELMIREFVTAAEEYGGKSDQEGQDKEVP